MLSQTICEAINRQINMEIHSAYAYFAMASYCKSVELCGSASWLEKQAQEELGHAKKFMDYLLDRQSKISLGAIAKPQTEFSCLSQVFELALKQERSVTASICEIMGQAIAEKDYATQGLLQWFINEQTEEEATADSILNKLKALEGNAAGIFFLDKMLGER